MGAGPIGYATSTVDTLADTIRVQDEMTVDIEALGNVQRTAAGDRDRASAATCACGPSTRRSPRPPAAFRASGTVQGDSVLAVEIVTGGNAARSARASGWTAPSSLSALLPLELAVGRRLVVGKDVHHPRCSTRC